MRVQLAFPGVYIPSGKNSFAFAVLASSQVDVGVGESLRMTPNVFVDVGPAFTYARKLLDKDALSVGATAHFMFRTSAGNGFSVVDLLRPAAFLNAAGAGDGMGIDFDLGATYLLPFKVLEFEPSVVASANNILGGGYDNISKGSIFGDGPYTLQRRFGGGFLFRRDKIGDFKEWLVALELADVGALRGSIFKGIHMGSEIRYSRIQMRAGVNQGYLGLGFGFDLTALQLDLAYYGEEMGSYAGAQEDRRIALHLGFQI